MLPYDAEKGIPNESFAFLSLTTIFLYLILLTGVCGRFKFSNISTALTRTIRINGLVCQRASLVNWLAALCLTGLCWMCAGWMPTLDPRP